MYLYWQLKTFVLKHGNIIIYKIYFYMKTRKMYNSSSNLKKMSIALALSSAMLCPAAANAAENSSVAPSPQSVLQSGAIKGKIVDETGEPMIGVTVLPLGNTKNGTITDLDGNFTVSNISGKVTLEISYIGYKTQKVTATPGTPLNIKMVPEANELDDVVVIGFGTVKKRDLTGSVASVKSDVIVQTPTSSVASAMQGRISGLDINDGELRIRGNRSISAGNSPLVVIDGVQGGSMSDLNPNDIESIDVLKDASSTAIYGSQGANGVIIITTKKPEAGKMSVSYNGYVTAAFRPDRADYRSPSDYYNTRKIAAQNAGLWNSEADDVSLFSSNEAYAAFKAGAWTNYEDLMQRKTTWSTKHTVTLSGGNEKTAARFSVGYANDGNKWKGNSGADKYTLRANIDHNFLKWISAGVSIQLTHTRSGSSPYEKAKNTGLELGSPYGYVDETTGEYVIGDKYVTYPLAADDYVNPMIDNEDGARYKAESYATNVIANGYLDIHPIDGLTFRSQLSTDLSNSSKGTFQAENHSVFIENGKRRSTSYMDKASSTYVEWNNIVTYNFKNILPEDHHLALTALTTWSKTMKDDLNATSNGQTLAGNLWWNLASNDNGENALQHASSYTQAQNFSYAARLQYDWKGRYLFTGSVRRDGCSKLAPGHKWEWFPSAAFAWRVSDEPWMKQTKSWLDDLKLRATYGVAGNSNVNPYSTQSGVTFANWSFGFQDIAANRYLLGVLDGSNYRIANKRTKWEMSTTFDLGFDAVLLNSRLNVTFDWYYQKTTDLLLSRTLPTSNGMDGKYATMTNVGSLRNTGAELTINSRNIVTKDFNWNSTLTFSANREKVTKLYGGANELQWGSSKETDTYMVGHPISSYKTFKYLGIYTTDEVNSWTDETAYYKDAEKKQRFQAGDIKVADLNGDHVIDQTNDVEYVGSKSPDWFAGFNNDFRYKNWDLSIYFYARWGQWGESRVANYDPSTGGIYSNFDYWVEGTNEGGSLPALYKGRKLFDYVGYQSLSYCDNSFIKLKRISLGYTLPRKAVKAMGINNVRIYATINDPLYFVKNDWQKHFDPEGNQRSVTVGLNVNF